MLLVITGNGKGKTTSAIGQALRVAGGEVGVVEQETAQGIKNPASNRVWFGQFIKSPKWVTGEDRMFARIPGIDHYKFGLGFVGILGDTLPRAKHKAAAQKALSAAARAIRSRNYKLVVLDEVNVAVSLKLISAAEVLKVVRQADKDMDVMLTGRGAPVSFLRAGDIVTECNELKHVFNKGMTGRRGREY